MSASTVMSRFLNTITCTASPLSRRIPTRLENMYPGVNPTIPLNDRGRFGTTLRCSPGRMYQAVIPTWNVGPSAYHVSARSSSSSLFFTNRGTVRLSVMPMLDGRRPSVFVAKPSNESANESISPFNSKQDWIVPRKKTSCEPPSFWLMVILLPRFEASRMIQTIIQKCWSSVGAGTGIYRRYIPVPSSGFCTRPVPVQYLYNSTTVA